MPYPRHNGLICYEAPNGHAGAPPLSCNLWLEQEVKRIGIVPRYDRRYRPLYAEWLRRYCELRGFAPVDRNRSFRAAVAGALARLCRVGRG